MSRPGEAHGTRASAGAVERLPVDERSPWWAEHCSRYVYAANLVPHGRVLDIASGSGFGAALLTQSGAPFVVGCDVVPDAVQGAAASYGGDATAFVAGSAVALPFGNGAFSAVVSLETLEHLNQPEIFLDELKRVMLPGGVLVLSTPNADVTRHYRRNPFHVHEYTVEELRGLLAERFAETEILGQRLASRRRVAPFLPGYDKAGTTADHFRLLAWKVCHRLPFAVKTAISSIALGRSFYPAIEDYVFSEPARGAHVIVAVCKRL